VNKVSEIWPPLRTPTSLQEFGWSLYRLWTYTLRPRALWRKVKKFYQRGVRGWSDEDTWSFDHYLTRVIVGGLAQLKEDAHGYPALLEPDPSLDALGGLCIDGPGHDVGMVRWRGILQEMITGFAADSLLQDSVQFTIEGGELYRDHELEAKLIAARSRGFDLFKEYYGALWD
jgi:hypothetical protein